MTRRPADALVLLSLLLSLSGGLSAGPRPPEQDLEGLMRQRYGVESGVVFRQAPRVQPPQLEPHIFRVDANALSEKFRDFKVSLPGAHSGPSGEIEPHPGVVLPPYVDPHAAGRLGGPMDRYFRSVIPPSSRDHAGVFHFSRPPDSTPIHVTNDSETLLGASTPAR